MTTEEGGLWMTDPDATSADLSQPLEPQFTGPLSSLDATQRARVAALNLAAPVLTGKAVLGGSRPPDVFDLLRASHWILTGRELDATPPAYPIESGEVIILGPEVFVDRDGTVISWAGQNFYLNNDTIIDEDEEDEDHD